MGVGEVDGPPKKKLKQAQLSFSPAAEKPSNKRKLNGDPSLDGRLSLKVFRKDSDISLDVSCGKENVKVDQNETSTVAGIVDLTEDPVVHCRDGTDHSGAKENNKSKTEGSDCEGDVEKKEEPSSSDQQVDNSELNTSLVESNHNLSAESETGDLNTSAVISSDEDANTAITLSAKKRRAARVDSKKAEREQLKEEKIRLKKEKDDLKRRKKEEKDRKKEEEIKLKEEEKKRKEEEKKRKEEEKKRKEDERKRREEAKEEEKKMKEEKRKQKEEAKEEEKRKKEDEKKKKEEMKEEDRKKKEDARLAEERKDQLTKIAFSKFFIQNKSKPVTLKKDETENSSEEIESKKFMPFPVKADMRLAVVTRHSISDEAKNVLSEALKSNQPPEKLYLGEIKEGLRKPCKALPTWALSEEQHDVIIVESVVEDKTDAEVHVTSNVKSRRQRAKLLQFHDNRRPPYWGTWRKKSKEVRRRNPFGHDGTLDYEVDSDSEWEDEDEGEDLDKEDDSDKEQSDDENVGENGYLLDNTFVPHGYLSDEEAAEEEEENLNPEDQKLKMKVLKQEFEQELQKKAERLKPKLLGCVWISNEMEVSKGSLYEMLMNFRCRWDEAEGPIDPSGPVVIACTPSPSQGKFPSTLLEQLVRFVHGSYLSRINLIHEFITSVDKEKHLSTVSKRAVSLKIKEIAHKTHDAKFRPIWEVSPELCAEYNLQPLPDLKNNSVIATPPPSETTNKPKDTPLVNFLKKASTSPQEPKKRIIPTLIAPAAKITNNTTEKIPISATPPAQPPVRRRITPITLSKTVTPQTKTTSTDKPAQSNNVNTISSFFRSPSNKKKDSSKTEDIVDSVDLCNDSN